MLLIIGFYLGAGLLVGGVAVGNYFMDHDSHAARQEHPLLASEVWKIVWLFWKILTIAFVALAVIYAGQTLQDWLMANSIRK